MKLPDLPRPIAIAAILVIVTIACVEDAAARTSADAQPRTVTPRAPLFDDELRHVRIFAQASPSVVHIGTVARARLPFSARATEVPRGSGTGFVWDERGHVVTNWHVLAGAHAASVTLADQSVHPARLVGAFPERDLAVLRIETPSGGLRALPLGTSAELQVGQSVVAIGNPFGLDQTMTVGIVSALEREIPVDAERTMRGLIQTDAAINPGNSGGPLLDSAGRLIGVTTAIYSPSGASAGVGFAIPVDEVNRIVPRLIRDGRFVRPSLGIEVASPRFLAVLGLPPGLAVLDLQDDGPAARAGLQPFRRDGSGRILVGDVIVAIDGAAVRTLDDLHARLEASEPGREVSLRVRRGRDERNVRVELAPGR